VNLPRELFIFLILEGPPGSGKTFVAEHIGRWLAHGQEHYRKWVALEELPDKVKERYEVVQFHESYGYEDFVQGFRPETTEQRTMVFERKPGVFLRFCEKARDQEGLWVMLIDEVNRGKPSKVFGELLFLLEYRNREISLSSGQLFSIPDNVVLIGTMNTADKSIALVDYALRRRFAFVPLQPVENGKAPVLESWMVENKIPNQDKLIDLFLKLNARVTQEHGEHFQVGHSYFMNKKLAEDTQFPGQTLSRIWKYQIQPLIREYSYTSTSVEIEEKYSIKQLLEYGKH